MTIDGKELKIYEVQYTVRVWCGGCYQFLPGFLKIPATSPQEAKKKIGKSQLNIFQIFEPEEIDLSEPKFKSRI